VAHSSNKEKLRGIMSLCFFSKETGLNIDDFLVTKTEEEFTFLHTAAYRNHNYLMQKIGSGPKVVNGIRRS